MSISSKTRGISRAGISKLAFGVCILATAVAAIPTASEAGPRPPVEAFATLPTFSQIAISPDGKKIAYSRPRADGNLDVVIYDLSTRAAAAIGLDANKVRDLQFEDGGQVLVTASGTSTAFADKTELYRVFAVDLEKRRSRMLLNSGGNMRALNTGAYIESMLPAAPNEIMMSTYDSIDEVSEASLNLYRVALDSDRVMMKARGGRHTVSWLADKTGEPVARVDLNLIEKTSRLMLREADGNWREGLKIENTSVRAISLVGQTASGRIVFRRDYDSEFGQIESLDRATGATSVIVRADGIELSSAITDRNTGELIGVNLGGLNPSITWLKSEIENAQQAIESRHEGKIVSIVDFTPDYRKFVAAVESPSTPRKYYLLDLDARQLRSLGASMPDLDNVPLGDVKATTFKSRDGLDIPVYVTMPPGHSNAKNAPTIVFPHGGPAARDYPRFDWWAQFMASRGYVVIQPQFRGSTGFGEKFADAGVRQWGKKMQDDVSDAVAWSVKEGITDASRVCIVGASYGGYAALAGATMTPDLYKCAVSVNGVSDLPLMMRAERSDAGGRRSEAVNYWTLHMGADDRTAMQAASPRTLAESVRAPILLIHGKDDTVVRLDQSQAMASALARADKPHKLVTLRGEDHWLSGAQTRLEMLRELDLFLSTNLGPGLE